MKCENCGNRVANVEYTQIVNGNKIHLHLCDRCARDLNINLDFSFDNSLFNLFDNLFDEVLIGAGRPAIRRSNFINIPRFGYNNCDDEFDNILKRINKKKSLSSESKDDKKEISKLKKELEACIKKEEYEQAAVIRDKIKNIEKRAS